MITWLKKLLSESNGFTVDVHFLSDPEGPATSVGLLAVDTYGIVYEFKGQPCCVPWSAIELVKVDEP